jgi:hypothetical protein
MALKPIMGATPAGSFLRTVPGAKDNATVGVALTFLPTYYFTIDFQFRAM